MKRKDFLIIVLVVALAGGLLLLSGQLSGGKHTPGGQLPTATTALSPTNGVSETDAPAVDVTASPTTTEQARASETPGAAATLPPAEAYLSVQIDQLVYDPIPLLEENQLELTQPDGKRNVVAFTRDSIVMHASNCDNQDCVHQGKVTLDNRENRVLMNMIICLPNRVVLTLLDAQEAQKQWEEHAVQRENP